MEAKHLTDIILVLVFRIVVGTEGFVKYLDIDKCLHKTKIHSYSYNLVQKLTMAYHTITQLNQQIYIFRLLDYQVFAGYSINKTLNFLSLKVPKLP